MNWEVFSILIGLLGLLFAVTSFWWIHARRGSLTAPAPGAFASVEYRRSFWIRLPLVIHNTGAATLVVESLRISVGNYVLEWAATLPKLRPCDKDVPDTSTPFSVEGRETRELFAEFVGELEQWRPTAGAATTLTVDAKTGGKWKKLVEFTWWPPTEQTDFYRTHRNAPPNGDVTSTDNRSGT